MKWTLVIMAIVTLLGGGGVLVAADAAVPGDALYGLDQQIEEVRLKLTSRPEARAELQLAFAKERLTEMQKLSAAGRTVEARQALDGYDGRVAMVARELRAPGGDKAAMAALLDRAMIDHNEMLVDLPGQTVDDDDGDDLDDEDGDRTDSPHCQGIKVHPVGSDLAQRYEVDYDVIIGHFCDGFGFGEIRIAYSLQGETGTAVADLFAMRDSGLGWGEIMQSLGIKGPPPHAGRPDHAGPPDHAKGNGNGGGPPEHAQGHGRGGRP